MHKDKTKREGHCFDKGKVGHAGTLTGAVSQVEYKGRLEGISIQREGVARSYRCTPQQALDVYARTARTKDGGIMKATRALKPLVTQPPATDQLKTPYGYFFHHTITAERLLCSWSENFCWSRMATTMCKARRADVIHAAAPWIRRQVLTKSPRTSAKRPSCMKG